MMNLVRCAPVSALVLLTVAAVGAASQDPDRRGEKPSFKNTVFPIIKKHCLPCHAEEQFNPSELSLDSYDLLMTGGKNGPAVVPGNPGESLLIQKLQEKPPFGDRMPVDPKKKKGQLSAKKLSEEEVRLLSEWIADGAKEN